MRQVGEKPTKRKLLNNLVMAMIEADALGILGM